MGLDTSHDCWHGAYSAFQRWREQLARSAGIPLRLMEGFYGPPNASSMEWLAPRDGGPICGNIHGPVIHDWAAGIAEWLPVKWSTLKPDPLHILLNHSDCDGEISAADCGPIADRLEQLLPELAKLPDDNGHIGSWVEKTQKFIDGLRLAATEGEPVKFM